METPPFTVLNTRTGIRGCVRISEPRSIPIVATQNQSLNAAGTNFAHSLLPEATIADGFLLCSFRVIIKL